MDVPTFRAVFPEFGSATTTPDAIIQFNLTLATESLRPDVWGDRLDAAVGYYAAHFVALAAQRVSASTSGSPAFGIASGLVTSRAVGSVSKSMDVTVGQTERGGSFNLTTYGQTYLTLLSSTAVGAMQF